MGEHKHNPTAIAAKAGVLPPKPKPVGKAESMRWCRRLVHDYLYKNTALGVIEREIRRNCIAYVQRSGEVERQVD